MKILILSPHIKNEVTDQLRQAGVTLFSASDSEGAWQILQFQGKTMDLAFIHREKVDGEGLVKKIKADALQADLPIVLISQDWNEADFAKHQSTNQGVNAYLKHPVSAEQICDLIQQITGEAVLLKSPELPAAESQPEIIQSAANHEVESNSFASSGLSMAIEEIPVAIEESTPALEVSELQIEPFDFQSSGSSQPPNLAPDPSFADEDPEASEALPYVYQKSGDKRQPDYFAQPIGDAVVPGGAAHAPDMETLKQYLLLREQDVAALSTQLKAAKDQAAAIERQLKEERSRTIELSHEVHEKSQRIADFDRERTVAEEAYQTELNELKFQSKAKTDKVKLLERHVRDAQEEIERIKERVRQDIRKIRVREKELENKIEIMRRDSEALLVSRENKIIELKRKLDLLEFNMDLLQNQYTKEKEINATLKERLTRVAQAVRVAGGIVDDPNSHQSEDLIGGKLKSA